MLEGGWKAVSQFKNLNKTNAKRSISTMFSIEDFEPVHFDCEANIHQDAEEDEFDQMISQVLGNLEPSPVYKVPEENTYEMPIIHETLSGMDPIPLAATMPSNGQQITFPSPLNTFSMPRQVSIPENQEEEPEKPKRPLSSYNLFFKAQRESLLKSLPVKEAGKRSKKAHGKIGFADLARTISAKWKKITPEEKAPFDFMAKQDSARYKREMEAYKNQQAMIEESRMNQDASIRHQGVMTLDWSAFGSV